LILATSAGWCFYSQVGVTDIPLSATFSAAMLFALPWISRRDKRPLPAAALFLGLAALAKGPVALVLAAPLALRWRNLLDWLHPRASLPFLAIATPWYILCYAANGGAFISDFFWKHNIGRFTSQELQHGQPWWFYLPVLGVLFLPWTPLLALTPRPAAGRDRNACVSYLLLWAVWPILFFSLSVNKLPGYILPAFPAIAALAAIGLSGVRRAAPWLAASALLTSAFAIVGPLVDIGGLARNVHPVFHPAWLFPIPFAAAAYLLDSRGKRLAAVACVACASTAGISYLKTAIGQKTFARELWRQVEPHASETCVGPIGRDWRYGINYYSVTPLPDCATVRRPLEIQQSAGNRPVIVIEGK
jgi:4-amino-4-deoxy-L-arabinose transferase-like glycosyltransferase